MTRLPNFFLLGAAKSGTTALYFWLETRPEVHLSSPKEPYFFEDEYDRGLDFYWQTYFARGYAGQPLVGDCRAAHLYLPYVPSRIHATVPDARLVAILRNPVERAFSHWWMQRCNGREKLGFDAALRANRQAIEAGDSFEGERAEELWRARLMTSRDHRGIRPVTARNLIEPGHYAQQLERYLEYFPRERLCVLLHDDLRAEPVPTLQRLAAFLGLDPAQVESPPRSVNEALTNVSLPLYRISRRLQLERVVPRRVLAALRTWISRFGSRPQMSDEARAWLRQHYAPHNRRLEALLDRDLGAWER